MIAYRERRSHNYEIHWESKKRSNVLPLHCQMQIKYIGNANVIEYPYISHHLYRYAMQRSQYQWLLHRNVKVGLYLLSSVFLNLVMLQFSLLTSSDISAI